MSNRKRRLKLGDIYEIPLPDGTNAYGRLYKECTLAIYAVRCNDVSELPYNEEYQYFVAVYKDLLQDGKWKVVGSRKFTAELYNFNKNENGMEGDFHGKTKICARQRTKSNLEKCI